MLYEYGLGRLTGGKVGREVLEKLEDFLGEGPSVIIDRLRSLAHGDQNYAVAGVGDVRTTLNGKGFDADPNFYKKGDKSGSSASSKTPTLGTQYPYDSRGIRNDLEERYPGGVKSTTVPALSKPNVKLANKVKEIKLKDGQKVRIAFNSKGLPIFDDYAKVDLRVNVGEFRKTSYRNHFALSTRKLREMIDKGEIPSSQFTPKALQNIREGKAQIKGYSWHHHEDTGRMQLVPTELHDKVKHAGWNSLNKGQ